jgi:hypothetical protein
MHCMRCSPQLPNHPRHFRSDGGPVSNKFPGSGQSGSYLCFDTSGRASFDEMSTIRRMNEHETRISEQIIGPTNRTCAHLMPGSPAACNPPSVGRYTSAAPIGRPLGPLCMIVESPSGARFPITPPCSAPHSNPI